MITKKAPLSSEAINSLGANLNRKTVSSNVPNKNAAIIFFCFSQYVNEET